jgi:hypothetical protein
VVSKPKCFVVRDHPVRSIKVASGIFLDVASTPPVSTCCKTREEASVGAVYDGAFSWNQRNTVIDRAYSRFRRFATNLVSGGEFCRNP